MLRLRASHLLLYLIPFLPYATGRVFTAHDVTAIIDPSSNHIIETSSRRSLTGEKCGLFNACADGLTCVKAAIGGGRCMPVECIVETIQKYNHQNGVANTMQTVTDRIFLQAGVTQEELALSRANDARSDQSFREDSYAMQAVVEVMNNMENPFPGLQEELADCSNVGNFHADGDMGRTATPGETMYYGFHLEGGALYDGEFSVLVALKEGQPNLTYIRGCFGGGGIGLDVSAVIGIGYTGDRNELMGCSALLTDNELGVLFAAGVDLGVTFPGVFYLDITLGLGLTGEGFGIGLCGNWPV